MSSSTRSEDIAESITGVLNTLGTYAQALDDGRTDDLVALFAADAVVDIMGQGVMEGRDAIRAGYLLMVPTGPQRHLLGNVKLNSISDGEASVAADLAVLKRQESGWAVQLTGRYQDTLRVVDGNWLFTRKVLSLAM